MTDPGALELGLGALRTRRSAKWRRYDDDVLPAWVAESDFALAEPVEEALRLAIARGDTGYADAEAAGLGEAFAGFAERRLGWSVDPAHVVATDDVVNGLARLVGVLSEPGEGIVINPPVYPPFHTLVREAGRELVEVPLQSDGRLDADGIAAAFAAGARALLLCNPHNPTGRVAGAEELAAIAELAAARDAWILSDEIHAPLTLPGSRHVPFPTVSEAARRRCIVLTSASKAFNLAGLKAALIITASEESRALVARMPDVGRHPGHLGVLASVAAFESGEPWLQRVIEVVDGNRRLLARLLDERLPAVGYREPEAGYLAWLDLSGLGLGEDPSEELRRGGRVALSPGPRFGAAGAGFARLNIGTSAELVAEAVSRMAEAVERRAAPSPSPSGCSTPCSRRTRGR